jgi:hypothetical protein
MPRSSKIVRVTVDRVGSEYHFEIENDGGKTLRLSATSDQVLTLADVLDDLLADEEIEQEPSA